MKEREYTDDYQPTYPRLIPSDEAEARQRFDRINDHDRDTLRLLDTETFLGGWWALFWLCPGLHPDDIEDWPEKFDGWRPLIDEAFRRLDAGEITDGQCYPAEAVHGRLWREMVQESEE
ncbi:MAG: hypothetical protein KDN20_17515 [Verrucomicrobiae bacterium]|nr:hypothetical protein [Verrucomicrobiae bacterium]